MTTAINVEEVVRGLRPSAALSRRAALATGNPRHFPMPGIIVDHWPVGE